jgi:hypothetical protein
MEVPNARDIETSFIIGTLTSARNRNECCGARHRSSALPVDNCVKNRPLRAANRNRP